MKPLLSLAILSIVNTSLHAYEPPLRELPPFARESLPAQALHGLKTVIFPVKLSKDSVKEKDFELHYEIKSVGENKELCLTSPQWDHIIACHLLDDKGNVIDIKDIVLTSQFENGCSYYISAELVSQAKSIRLSYLDESVSSKPEIFALTPPFPRESQRLDFEIISPILARTPHIQEASHQYWVEVHPDASMHLLGAQIITSSPAASLTLKRHDETRSLYGKLHMNDFPRQLDAELKISYTDQELQSVTLPLQDSKGTLELQGFKLLYERMSEEFIALYIPSEMVIKSVIIKDAEGKVLARHGQRSLNLDTATGLVDKSMIKEVYELYHSYPHSIEIQYFPGPYKNTTITLEEPLQQELFAGNGKLLSAALIMKSTSIPILDSPRINDRSPISTYVEIKGSEKLLEIFDAATPSLFLGKDTEEGCFSGHLASFILHYENRTLLIRLLNEPSEPRIISVTELIKDEKNNQYIRQSSCDIEAPELYNQLSVELKKIQQVEIGESYTMNNPRADELNLALQPLVDDLCTQLTRLADLEGKPEDEALDNELNDIVEHIYKVEDQFSKHLNFDSLPAYCSSTHLEQVLADSSKPITSRTLLLTLVADLRASQASQFTPTSRASQFGSHAQDQAGKPSTVTHSTSYPLWLLRQLEGQPQPLELQSMPELQKLPPEQRNFLLRLAISKLEGRLDSSALAQLDIDYSYTPELSSQAQEELSCLREILHIEERFNARLDMNDEGWVFVPDVVTNFRLSILERNRDKELLTLATQYSAELITPLLYPEELLRSVLLQYKLYSAVEKAMPSPAHMTEDFTPEQCEWLIRQLRAIMEKH